MIKKTVIARALAIAFSTAALNVALAPAAFAQSNAAGTIFGRADGGAASIVLQNTDTGVKRTLGTDAGGRYNATAMPPGHYKVELVRDGKVVNTTEVDVIIGQGVEASFSSAQTVQVTGRRNRIDVSNTNNGSTFTAKELSKLPVQQSVAAIIQLAPNTTRADSRYAAGASFGGGGASENAYYINGFPVTNPLTQLGASELPFGAIAQAQVLTGGFGAEFGRSVGGVVNITTKSGTNNWDAGASVSIEPDSLRAKYKNVYYGNTGAKANAATDGTLYQQNDNRQRSEKIVGAYVGGPIIEDKLFMFAALEGRRYDQDRVYGIRTSSNLGATGFESTDDKLQRYTAKFDWNISDNHRVEATLIGDNSKTDRRLYSYDYATGQHGAAPTASQHYKNSADFTPAVGGDVRILRYVGNLTDNLTISALTGRSKTKSYTSYDNVGGANTANLFQVSAASNTRVPGLNYSSPQVLSGAVDNPASESEVKSTRFDVEYKLGSHMLRGGFDNVKLDSSQVGQYYGGGGIWVYQKVDPNAQTDFGTTTGTTAAGGGYGAQGYFVQKRIFNSVTGAGSHQDARYLEDRWQVTKDVLVTLGVRDEGFKNINGDGDTFLEIDHKIQPRAAASWDVNGDASFKVFGSAGRYALQIPTHLAVRGASRSTLTRQAFTYTGTDANGLPLGLVALGGPYSTNNELGQSKDPKSVTAKGLEATYQDELTLGFEKALSADLNIGMKATYRELKATIDDYCDTRLIDKYAADHKIAITNDGYFSCASFNPGRDNTFVVDFQGNKTYSEIHLTAAELGFEQAKRTYTALDLFAEHPLRSGWYGRVNYTWSRSRGNTEGQTRSDNAQTDVAATSTWDNPELMVNAYGNLPNDRKHQMKAYGFFEVTPEWSVGGNFLAASGRPRSCFGWNPSVPRAVNYGSVYFYCDKAVPRSTLGTLPWDIRLDLNLAYQPAFLTGLTAKMEVFNVANKQTAQTIDETYNVNTTAEINPTYGRVISYTAPRAVKFTVEYNRRF
ncbi:TonB-dependent receptor [Duganella aceris]|uniref:TonB-dependent receptor n=1 Tax=Duganella aceris TaxID=2703883 RepID=A0ABX0FVE4_9BURK|nr:TonB-dependent receptor [Duganella aceris]NGZ88350.1 TonB-dependent receptor [Duganella aceris]